MRLTRSKRGDAAVIALSGELNADSIGPFNDAVRSARGEQMRDFILDLCGVPAIDSAGLEALTGLQRQCEEELGMVQLCCAGPTVLKILEMTRLSQQFTVHETLEQAEASFAPV